MLFDLTDKRGRYPFTRPLLPFDAALAQKMSDRAVRVIQATEAGELLPCGTASASHFECKFCSYVQRCWGGV